MIDAALMLMLAANWRLEPQPPMPLEGNPDSIVAGDVDGDGKADLVVTTGKRRLAVYLGDGKGGFQAQPVVGPLPGAAGDLVLADINRDGKLDLAATDHDTYRVLLMLGDGKGNFAAAPGSPIRMRQGQKPHTHGLAVMDINNDDALDLITINADDNDIAVLTASAPARFETTSTAVPVGRFPHPPAVADWNSDGKRDLLVPNSGSQDVTMLLGDGRGSFQAGKTTAVPGAPYFAVAGDLDGNGRADAAVSHAERNILSVLLTDGQGGFKINNLTLRNYAWWLGIADMDGDRKQDIIAAANSGVVVFLGDGAGAFRTAAGSPFLVPQGTWHLAIADFNGDGLPDVATANFEKNSVTVLLGRH